MKKVNAKLLLFLIVAALFVQAQEKLINAYTQDQNGNGYLDGIRIHFSAPVNTPSSYLPNVISISSQTSTMGLIINIEPISIKAASAAPDSVFIATLSENQSLKEPQVDYKPLISIKNWPGINAVDSFKCKDGAAPVIWAISKTINYENPLKDRMKITFAEPIAALTQNAIMIAIKPDLIFESIAFEGSDTLKEENPLIGIDSVKKDSKSSVSFYFKNGQYALATHHFRIRADADSIFADTSGNKAGANNQYVRVVAKGYRPKLLVVPNAVNPTSKHSEKILTYHGINAYKWCRSDGGIALFAQYVTSDTIGFDYLEASLSIYDRNGALVYYRENTDDILPKIWLAEGYIPGETKDVIMYWNGMHDDGTEASFQEYTITLNLKTRHNQSTLTASVHGTGDPPTDSSNNQSCGFGASLAIFPLVYSALPALCRRRRRRCCRSTR